MKQQRKGRRPSRRGRRPSRRGPVTKHNVQADPIGIYQKLFEHFGQQHWWPAKAKDPEARSFEISVGAILTQNTAWTNVEQALEKLRKAGKLSPKGIRELPQNRLAQLIRPSGYFNQKAKKLKVFVAFLDREFGGRMGQMRQVPLRPLRRQLLALFGIGPETADSILLYALGKPIFVVDAYTRRVLARHSFIDWEASYDQIQSLFMGRLPRRPKLFNEYHALFVSVGKELCKTHPRCELCPLRTVGKLRLTR